MLKCLLPDGTQRPPVDNITSPSGTSSWPPFFTASHHFVVWDLVINEIQSTSFKLSISKRKQDNVGRIHCYKFRPLHKNKVAPDQWREAEA